MKNIYKNKTIVLIMICTILVSNLSFSAVVSDNDGSAFITKAEFDSLKNNFQAQIDGYNSGIDSKIDSAIAAYLSGVKLNSEIDLANYYNDWETNLGAKVRWIGTSATLDSYIDFQNKAVPWGIYTNTQSFGQEYQLIPGTSTKQNWPANRNYTPYPKWATQYKMGIKIYTDTYICDRDGYVTNYARRFALNQKNNKVVYTSGYWGIYNYNIKSRSDGKINKMGELTFTFGDTYKGVMDYTNKADNATHIYNIDFVDWVVDYDTDNTENKGIILYPKRTTAGLDSSAWGTAVPVAGDDLRCAYMGMLGYRSLKSGAMTFNNTTNDYHSNFGITSTKWSMGTTAKPTYSYGNSALALGGYISDAGTDLGATNWNSGNTGHGSYYVVPMWTSTTGYEEVYPVLRRMIKQRTTYATVSTANFNFPLKDNIGSITMFFQGYVYGSKLRHNIGSNLGSIKLRYPTDLVGSQVSLNNGIPITKTQKKGKVTITLNSTSAGTMYFNSSKVSDITTNSTSNSFSIISGNNTINLPGDIDQDRYIYMSFLPSGTSASGYTLTINSCKEISES